MFDRRLITILSIVFVQLCGAALILPILPLFAERQFNLHPSSVSLLVSSYFVTQFFAGPLLGQLSDRYGRIPLLIISQLGSAASFFLMAAAGNAWLLFVARGIDGITGGNIIIAQAYVSDITPREKRTEAFGYIYAAFGIGFIIGPALGGLLAAWFGARVPFVVAGAAALVTSAMCLLLEETVPSSKKAALSAGDEATINRSATGHRSALSAPQPAIRLSPAQVLRNPPLLRIMEVGFIGQFGLGMVQATFALYAAAILFRGAGTDATNVGIGLLLAVVGVGQFVTQTWLIRPLKRRFGDGRLVILGTVLRVAALVVYAVAMTPGLAAIGSLLFAVGMGLTMPSLQTLATQTVDESMRGGVLGVLSSAVSLAIILSTAIAGTIFAAGATLPYWTGAVLALVSILPALGLMRQARQEFQAPQHSVSQAD